MAITTDLVLYLTDSALKRARALLKKQPAAGLRVAITTKGCSGYSYTVDYASEPGGGDATVTRDGITVFVDPEAVGYISGSEMDYVEDKFFSGFVFRNPNEKGRCGCGESFTV